MDSASSNVTTMQSVLAEPASLVFELETLESVSNESTPQKSVFSETASVKSGSLNSKCLQSLSVKSASASIASAALKSAPLNSVMNTPTNVTPIRTATKENIPPLGKLVTVQSTVPLKQSTTMSVVKNAQMNRTFTEDDSDAKLWPSNTTNALITAMKECDAELETKMKKTVFTKIADKLNAEYGCQYTWAQCNTKWKGLKRTYKDNKLHNSTSGKKRKTWEYFDAVNEILFNKPEINPVATCSSHEGLIVAASIESTSSASQSDPDDPQPFDTDSKSIQTPTYESHFKRKRKSIDNPMERRHKEKMARTDRFLDSFDKLVDVIAVNKKKDCPDDNADE